MEINDLYGKPIAISDLNAAIKQARLRKGYRHENPNEAQQIVDLERQKYWTDVYLKLKELKSTI